MGDEEEESRQAAIIRRNWHRCSRWDADLIYLSRLSGILILVRGQAFSNDGSSAPSFILSPFFLHSPHLFLSSSLSSGQLVFVDRPRRGENCLRIGCISGFRGSCSPSSASPFFFSSSLSPREEGSQRGRYKSDTPALPIQATLLVFFAGYFFKLEILLFFFESFSLERLIFVRVLFFKSKQFASEFFSFRFKDWCNVFLNRSIVRLPSLICLIVVFFFLKRLFYLQIFIIIL